MSDRFAIIVVAIALAVVTAYAIGLTLMLAHLAGYF
jgi:hypothetical protein